MPRNQSNRSGSRRGINNNPEGKNQYNSGLFSVARDRPATAAITAAGAVAAGVFLWSKRAQISDQLSQLSDQIGEWTDQMGSDRSSRDLETVGSGTATAASGTSSTANRNRSSTAGGRANASNGDFARAGKSETPIG